MADQFSILAKVKLDTADIQSQLNTNPVTVGVHADTSGFEMSISVANAIMREFIDVAESMAEQTYELDAAITELI